MPTYAGSFLVARPSLQDPNFRKSVVLLLQHGSGGAFGLVVNRPAKVEGLPFLVFAGGPCGSEGLLMLHSQADWIEAEEDVKAKTVAPGVFLGDASCLKQVKEMPEEEATRYRMFAGYAGWGPGQLEGELAAGAWAIVSANAELLFNTPLEEMWTQLLPPAIPEPSLN
jgi:putative transcriptional regulator